MHYFYYYIFHFVNTFRQLFLSGHIVNSNSNECKVYLENHHISKYDVNIQKLSHKIHSNRLKHFGFIVIIIGVYFSKFIY